MDYLLVSRALHVDCFHKCAQSMEDHGRALSHALGPLEWEKRVGLRRGCAPHVGSEKWGFLTWENAVHYEFSRPLGATEGEGKERKERAKGSVEFFVALSLPAQPSAGVVFPGCLVQVWFWIEPRADISMGWCGPAGLDDPGNFCVRLGHCGGAYRSYPIIWYSLKNINNILIWSVSLLVFKQNNIIYEQFTPQKHLKLKDTFSVNISISSIIKKRYKLLHDLNKYA